MHVNSETKLPNESNTLDCAPWHVAAAWETLWPQQHRDEAASHEDPNNQQELEPRLGLDARRRSDAQQRADGEAALRFHVDYDQHCHLELWSS